MIRELQTPAPGSKPLSFKNHYSTGLLSQVNSCTLSNSPDKLPSMHSQTCAGLHACLGASFAQEHSSSAQLPTACIEALRPSVTSHLAALQLFLHALAAYTLTTCYLTFLVCVQFVTCMAKNMMVYWRNTEYNAVRLFSTCFLAFLFGSIYWGLGDTRWVLCPRMSAGSQACGGDWPYAREVDWPYAAIDSVRTGVCEGC